jgi:hypothetical protein
MKPVLFAGKKYKNITLFIVTNVMFKCTIFVMQIIIKLKNIIFVYAHIAKELGL